MIFDERTEGRKAEEGEQGNSTETIPLSEIAAIAAVGLTYCKDYCSSRETVGQASAIASEPDSLHRNTINCI